MVARPRAIRAVLVLLLLGGAYLALEPWVTCASALGGRLTSEMVRVCTFGSGFPDFPAPRWPNVVVSLVYLAAAVWVARSKRIDFAAAGEAKR